MHQQVRTLIHFYLEHEAERERIASAGRQEALRNHTYDRRVEEILKRISEHPVM